jgi:hypothetical protein
VFRQRAYKEFEYAWMLPVSEVSGASDLPRVEFNSGIPREVLRELFEQLKYQSQNNLFADWAATQHRDLGARDPVLTAPVVETLVDEGYGTKRVNNVFVPSLWTSEVNEVNFKDTWMAWRAGTVLCAPGSRPYCRFRAWRPPMWNRLAQSAIQRQYKRNTDEGTGEVDLAIHGCIEKEENGVYGARRFMANVLPAGALHADNHSVLHSTEKDRLLSVRLHDLIMNALTPERGLLPARDAGSRRCLEPYLDASVDQDNRILRMPYRGGDEYDKASNWQREALFVAKLLQSTANHEKSDNDSSIIVDVSAIDMTSLVRAAERLVPQKDVLAGEHSD